MKSCVLVVAALAACSDNSSNTTTDAAPRPDAAPTCPPQSAPLADGAHELYLAFEGVTLALGDCDDARTNCSSLVAQGSTDVPAFLEAVASRATRIAAITAMVQDTLAPFSVDVVTTRPGSGDFRMIAVGGTSDAITGMTALTLAVKPVCDATNRNGIALVFEGDPLDELPDRTYADTIAGAFGRLVGLVPTSLNGDCMCTATTCSHTQACMWSASAGAQAGNSCDRVVQNEQQLLMDAVGCR